MEDWRKVNPPEIIIKDTKEQLLDSIAQNFINKILTAQKKNAVFSVILGGGRTPVELNQKIVNLSNQDPEIKWSDVNIFFSDERCVSQDHKDSNYKMINDTLVKPLNIKENNAYRIKGELHPKIASEEYEKAIFDFMENKKIESIDLAVLGLGTDCHTASLFPNSLSLSEDKRLVVPGGRGSEGLERVTLTYPILNSTKDIWIIVSGKEKSKALKNVLLGDFDPYKFPAQGINSYNGSLKYMIDKEAAAEL